MTTPTKLRRLRRATDAAITRATLNKCFGPINWADLRCVEAQAILNDSGEERLCVVIEEASPDAVELHRIVNADLAKHGWPNVEVSTEW